MHLIINILNKIFKLKKTLSLNLRNHKKAESHIEFGFQIEESLESYFICERK